MPAERWASLFLVPGRAMIRMNRPSSRRILVTGPHGFTLIELLIVLSIVGVLASVSMAFYWSARVRGREAAAVATLLTIDQAQFAFAQACGNQRYAPTLASLTTPMPTTGHGFLSADLGADPLLKTGYRFEMTGTVVTDGSLTCTGLNPVASYQVTADPERPGQSGIRFFATNTDRVVYEDTVTFVSNMPETGAPGHGRETK
jgi:prepilin-type N-terminal cleavage/methylation domain-containing protein